jgi:hypothetical protein
LNKSITEEFIIEYLSIFKDRDNDRDLLSKIKENLRKIKSNKVKKNDENGAKFIWCLEQITEIQERYLDAYGKLTTGKYYDAWCEFEKCELALEFLKPHFSFQNNEYCLLFIHKHILQYQSLYPYKLFLSPELLEHEKKCNICGKILAIRNPCGHEVGEIYKGEMCYRIVTKIDVLGISFVESPVQKYSVPFTKDEKTGESVDHYNYSLLKYLIDKLLQSPFDSWKINWTKKMHPHEKFAGVGRNKKCPCGSGDKYKKCCLNKAGVLRPHCEFLLENPPENPVTTEYTY